MTSTQDVLNASDIIVIKIGSAVLTDAESGEVNEGWLQSFIEDVKALHESGKKIILVSSGAVALGRKDIGIDPLQRPSEISLELKQAAASVGQFYLFNAYFQRFQQYNLTAGQILLTMSETEDWRMHLNARETIATLLDRGIIPIINENDTISTGEIRFGDNDKLAVRVAQMIDADSVLLLSTTDGLYDGNPDENPDAAFMPVVDSITEDHVEMAGDAVAGISTGGMKSKIEAAISATVAGIHLIITNGLDAHPIQKLMADDGKKNTIFIAAESKATARQIWIQSHLNPKGNVIADDGAAQAIKDGSSLLPIGVRSVEGEFERGDIVLIKNEADEHIGIGITAFSYEDAFMILGRTSEDIPAILGYAGRTELIHRNDMVLHDDPLHAIPNADN